MRININIKSQFYTMNYFKLNSNQFSIILLFLLFILNPVFLSSNSAQTGFWSAGGSGNFTLLFPEDSTAFQKIQMVEELVSIQLYKGYAVIKAKYFLANSTKDTVKMKVGYPLNSSFSYSKSQDAFKRDILFDSLYAIQVKNDGKEVKMFDELKKDNNWYVWEDTFLPKDTLVSEVYFVVNTNMNLIKLGYSSSRANGFIYLLETGANWKQPINKGEIRIEMKDNMTTDMIWGMEPDSTYLANKQFVKHEFNNLSPTYKNNIVLAYNDQVMDFNFKEVVKNQNNLFNSIDSLSEKNLNYEKMQITKFGSPFNLEGNKSEIRSMLNYILVPIFVLFLVFLYRKKFS